MEQYTKGTGGGPGDDANYVCWKDRDPSRLAGYSDQPSRIYLTVIHMWDRDYAFPLVVSKEPMPDDCQFEDEDDSNDDRVNRTPPPAKKDAADDSMMKAIRSMTAHRTKNHIEMMSYMTDGDATDNNAPVQYHNIVARIADTNKQLIQFEEHIFRLEEKKRVIKEGLGSSKRKKKRAKTVKEDIKITR